MPSFNFDFFAFEGFVDLKEVCNFAQNMFVDVLDRDRNPYISDFRVQLKLYAQQIKKKQKRRNPLRN